MFESSLNNPSGSAFPSYTNWIGISDKFTAVSDGFLVIAFYHSSDGSNTLTVSINGVSMGGFQCHDYDNQNLTLMLKKGDVVSLTGGARRFQKFCPLR